MVLSNKQLKDFVSDGFSLKHPRYTYFFELDNLSITNKCFY